MNKKLYQQPELKVFRIELDTEALVVLSPGQQQSLPKYKIEDDDWV